MLQHTKTRRSEEVRLNTLKMLQNKARYNVIVKVGEERFLKYRNVTNLLRFTSFLDDKHSTWRYFNVFDTVTKKQVGNFTSAHRPTTRHL